MMIACICKYFYINKINARLMICFFLEILKSAFYFFISVQNRYSSAKLSSTLR